jgi:hypothetical protein
LSRHVATVSAADPGYRRREVLADLCVGDPDAPLEQVGGEEVQRQDPLRLGPKELRSTRTELRKRPNLPGASRNRV